MHYQFLQMRESFQYPKQARPTLRFSQLQTRVFKKIDVTFNYNYTYDLKSVQQNQPVKGPETHSYAFSSRYKIQRGDGTVNPFVPTQQLGRNTTLDFQG